MTVMRGGRMTLFSTDFELDSHRVRLVLAEKGVNFASVDIEDPKSSEELENINPYQTVPTLVDRDLVLYDAKVIMEYLDERFPHPPLLPVYPVARAKSRLMVYRIEQDWYPLMRGIQQGDFQTAEQAKSELVEGLTNMAPVFKEFPYFLSEEFSLVDCTMAPILWQLDYYGIELPKQAEPVLEYARQIFDRPTFEHSLTQNEQEIYDEENVL